MHPHAWSPLGVGIVSCLGTAALLVMTFWGAGTSPDSVHYIRVARAFLALDTSIDAAATAQFPPLYPLLLSVVSLFGSDPYAVARWVNAILFAANICLLGLAVWDSSSHARWLSVIGAVLMAGSTSMLLVHGSVLSEPLFLVLVLSGFGLLARYLEHDSRPHLLWAALLIGLSVLTRYAGAACVATGMAGIVLLGRPRLRQRIIDTLLFGGVSSLPAVSWALRNVLVAGTSTNRELGFHPVGWPQAWEALHTVTAWLLLPQSTPGTIRLAACIAIFAFATMTFVRTARKHRRAPALATLLLLFIFGYMGFLAVSISLFDANTPLDDRILLPVLAAGIVVALTAIDLAWPLLRARPSAMYGVVTLLAAFAAGHVIRGSTVIARGHADGLGFSSVEWQTSTTLARVRALPDEITVYSNAPEIVYLHTRRSARSLPRRRFLMTQLPNDQYAAELAAVGQDIAGSCAVVVYLRSLTQRSMPSEQDLRQDLPLKVLSEDTDGVILTSPSCQP
ncbi:MAG: ArnT family glycosyltransferase [Vicinamibacterales bacterium]